jgi:DNA-binding CsgD family transcriptional regulator
VFLSSANAPLLWLVVPIALIGWRWGARWALGAAALAVALSVAPIWQAGHVDVFGDLSRATAFVTVAILAGLLYHESRNSVTPVSGIAASPGAPASNQAPGTRAEDLLSPRELQVLAMIAEGAPNSEIAKRLVIADTTVQSHVQHILQKLGVRNRTEAAARYLRR